MAKLEWTLKGAKKLWEIFRSNKDKIKKVEDNIKTLNKQKEVDIKHHGFTNAGKKIQTQKTNLKKLQTDATKKIQTQKTNLKKLQAENVAKKRKLKVLGLGTLITVGGGTTAGIIINKMLKDTKPYTIKKGDTLSEIARDNDTTLKAIQEANPHIKDLNKIRPGQEIKMPKKVPDRKSVYQGMTKSEMTGITKDNVVERKHGGQIGTPRGVGAALRGYGKGYK